MRKVTSRSSIAILESPSTVELSSCDICVTVELSSCSLCVKEIPSKEESFLYVLKNRVKVDILNLDFIVCPVDGRPEIPHGPLLDY